MACCGCGDNNDVSPIKKNRGMTDIFFLILFMFFIFGVVFVGVFSYIKSRPERILYGYDVYGNICGRDNTRSYVNSTWSGVDMTSKPYVFFFTFKTGRPTKSRHICVSVCPNSTELETPTQVWNYHKRELCDYSVQNSTTFERAWFRDDGKGLCPALPVMSSVDQLNRCIPSLSGAFDLVKGPSYLYEAANDIILSDYTQHAIADISKTWKQMLILLCGVLILCIVLLVLLQCISYVAIWLFSIIAVLGSVGAAGFMWYRFYEIKKIANPTDHDVPVLQITVDAETAYLVYSILATIVAVIILILTIVMFKRMLLVSALFGETSKCIYDIPCLMLSPFIVLVCVMAWIFVWCLITACLASFDTYEETEDGFFIYKIDKVARGMFIYHFIALLWIGEFIIGMNHLAVAGAVADWFFTPKAERKKYVTCMCCNGCEMAWKYHIGSVALGAFLITLVRIPRAILMYIDAKYGKSQTDCAKFCLKCCACCLWCLEKCLKFLTDHTYVVIAMNGTNFFTSCSKALGTLASNALNVVAINTVGNFIIFLAKVAVTSCALIGSVFIFKLDTELHYFWLPTLVTGLVSYVIAHLFFEVFDDIVDAVFFCFAKDQEDHDGSDADPYFMAKSLLKFVEDTDKETRTWGDYSRHPDPVVASPDESTQLYPSLPTAEK